MGKYFARYNKGEGWIGKERDLTQIGKDNNVVDGCLGRNGVKGEWTSSVQWGEFHIPLDLPSEIPGERSAFNETDSEQTMTGTNFHSVGPCI